MDARTHKMDESCITKTVVSRKTLSPDVFFTVEKIFGVALKKTQENIT